MEVGLRSILRVLVLSVTAFCAFVALPAFAAAADVTAPALTAEVNDGQMWVPAASVPYTLSAADTESGLESVTVNRRVGTYRPATGTCAVSGATTTFAVPVSSGQPTVGHTDDDSLNIIDGRCYTYVFTARDVAGNEATLAQQMVGIDAAGAEIEVQITKGSNPSKQYIRGNTIYINNAQGAGSFTVTERVLSAPFGIMSVSFPEIATIEGGSWGGPVLDTTAPFRTDYTWDSGTPLLAFATIMASTPSGQPAYDYFRVERDVDGPSSGELEYGPGFNAAGDVEIVATPGEDAGAGVRTVVIAQFAEPCPSIAG